MSPLDAELWRRAQARREAELSVGLEPADRMVVPLVLSLARLAAQRDLRRWITDGERGAEHV